MLNFVNIKLCYCSSNTCINRDALFVTIFAREIDFIEGKLYCLGGSECYI